MSNWVLAFNLSDILYLREYIPWNSPYDCCCEQFIKKLNLDLFQKLEALALDNDFVTTHFATKWDIEDNYRGITELLKLKISKRSRSSHQRDRSPNLRAGGNTIYESNSLDSMAFGQITPN